MDQRERALEKDNVKFLDEMKIQQEEFKNSIDNMERTIQKFYSHQSVDEHESIAKDVESVNEQLVKFNEEARKYNNKENLFNLDTTDYSKIKQMESEFRPYSNLWTTTTKWKTYSESWLHDEWNTLDAVNAERFVEEGSRLLTGVLRHFKDKDLSGVYDIAKTIKGEIDAFKPKVPLMVALRKNGMKDRHWEEISNRVGFTVKPNESFTFQTVNNISFSYFIIINLKKGFRS